MEIIKGFLMGALQGLTEFLPVSSSGHLVLLKSLIHLKEQGIAWEVILHLSTLLAVLVYYRHKIIEYLKWRNLLLLIIGTIPAGIVGVLFKSRIESMFTALLPVSIAFLITAGYLYLTKKQKGINENITPLLAFVIGIGQSIAIIPGISRSGFTITTALLLGIKSDKAVEFSFMLSIPAILGAFVLESRGLIIPKSIIPSLSVGAISAFLFGLFAIASVIKSLAKRSFYKFSYYLMLIFLFSLVWAIWFT